MINARMTSDKGTIVDRLYDYVDQIEATFDRFANAPIDVACFGCTGASYLIGQAREAEICETILRKSRLSFRDRSTGRLRLFYGFGSQKNRSRFTLSSGSHGEQHRLLGERWV